MACGLIPISNQPPARVAHLWFLISAWEPICYEFRISTYGFWNSISALRGRVFGPEGPTHSPQSAGSWRWFAVPLGGGGTPPAEDRDFFPPILSLASLARPAHDLANFCCRAGADYSQVQWTLLPLCQTRGPVGRPAHRSGSEFQVNVTYRVPRAVREQRALDGK